MPDPTDQAVELFKQAMEARARRLEGMTCSVYK